MLVGIGEVRGEACDTFSRMLSVQGMPGFLQGAQLIWFQLVAPDLPKRAGLARHLLALSVLE